MENQNGHIKADGHEFKQVNVRLPKPLVETLTAEFLKQKANENGIQYESYYFGNLLEELLANQSTEKTAKLLKQMDDAGTQLTENEHLIETLQKKIKANQWWIRICLTLAVIVGGVFVFLWYKKSKQSTDDE